MIDTVILTIPRKDYKILDPHRFQPSANFIEKSFLVKGVNNPTAKEKADGIYRPRLTIMSKPTNLNQLADIPLRIEFSVPKLLFNNNLDEVENKNFNDVCDTLRFRMKTMGVETTTNAIKQAKVSSLHVSKNILLKEYTARHVIGELGKVIVNKRTDIEATRFKNSGTAVYFHTNSHQFVLYDKVADLNRQQGRAVDKDQTQMQFEIFNRLQTSKNDYEILRLEARLVKPQKLKSVLNSVGHDQPPIFASIFKKGLCQKIMNQYWQNIVGERNYFVFDTERSPQKFLQQLIKKHDTNPKQYIYLVGLKTLCKDAKGIRGLRLCLEKKCSDRTWSRIAKDFDILNSLTNKQKLQSWLPQIEQGLKEFKAFKWQDCRVKNSKVYL